MQKTTAFNSFENVTIEYFKINDALNNIFFDGRFAFSPLYLDMEDSLLEELSSQINCPRLQIVDKVSSVVSNILNTNKSHPLQFFLNCTHRWDEDKRHDKPPFTAFLCMLSYAAESMQSDEQYSSLNYYERLFELLDVKDMALKKAIRDEFSKTVLLWRSLNNWLDQYDGSLGLQTARPLNNFPYVSYPMSQALVRDADRENLYKMFEYFRLQAGERIRPEDFYYYVREWVISSYSSKSLKNLWKISGVDEIIAETASDELFVWKGPARGDHEERVIGKPIVLGGQYTGWPYRKLSLFVAAQSNEISGDEILSLNKDYSDKAAQNAFENCNEILLSNSFLPDSFNLEPAAGIALSGVLSSDLCLEVKGEVFFTRRSKPIVPLRKDDNGSYYYEVSRASLVAEHIILCHQSCEPSVSIFLKKYAREGFEKLSVNNISNLPKGWVVFEKVQILHSPFNESNNLQSLVPLSDNSLNIVDGLKLNGNIFHSSIPVEIIAASNLEEFDLKIFEGSSEDVNELLDRQPLKEAKASDGNAYIKMFDQDIVKNSNLVCILEKNRKILKSKRISFRNADQPMRIPQESSFLLAHKVTTSDPLSVLSAGPISSSYEEALFIKSAKELALNKFILLEPIQALKSCQYSEVVEQDWEVGRYTFNSNENSGEQENCTLRGYHYWICQPFEKGDKKQLQRWMVCSNCKQSVFAKCDELPKNKKASATTKPRKICFPKIERIDFEQDVAFDAVCFLGSGHYRKLSEIIANFANEKFSGQQYVRNMNSIGHINISMKFPELHYENWCVAPPHFVVLDKDEAFLVGFRNPELIKRIKGFAYDAGLSFNVHELNQAPDRVSLQGDLNKIQSIADSSVSDSFGRSLFVINDLSIKLTAMCPKLSEVYEALGFLHVERNKNEKLELFDPLTNSWSEVSFDAQPGAYRTVTWGKTHYYVDEQYRKIKAPYEIVKLLSARLHRVSLYEYDNVTKTFTAPLGCPIFGMYERALISCSGFLPQRDGAKIIYTNINETVGETIIALLYS